jgi:hypothetical protein
LAATQPRKGGGKPGHQIAGGGPGAVTRLFNGRLIFRGRPADKTYGNGGRGDRPAGRILFSSDTAQKRYPRPEYTVIFECERFPQNLQDSRASMVSLTQQVTGPLFCLIQVK